MKARIAILLLVIISIFSLDCLAQAPSTGALLLNVKGGIGPATQYYVERGFKAAEQQQARLVIIQMDTPGGLSTSMRGIIKTILSSPIPVVSYVAPSGSRAASAGTYILYASQIAAMAPGTNLGSATPVSVGASDKGKDKKTAKKPTASELKALNDAKAYIRGLAQLRGRNIKWAELAVSKAASLSANEALRKNVINVIANDIPSLLAKINGKTVKVAGKMLRLKTKNLTVTPFHPDWRMKFLAAITNPSVAYILLMLGFYGLFFEFANPGYILPGVIGAIACLIALYAFQLLPINYVGLGLIILGLAFIVAEVFMPNIGALGIGGAIALLVGSIMLFDHDVPGFQLPLSLIITVTLVTIAFFIFILQFAVRARHRPVVSGVEAMIGQRATVVVDADGVRVSFNGELWWVDNASSLQNGQQVTIAAVKGLKLVVKPVDNER